MADRKRHIFRRLEINALTTPELLAFLEAKIPDVLIKPGRVVATLAGHTTADGRPNLKTTVI